MTPKFLIRLALGAVCLTAGISPATAATNYVGGFITNHVTWYATNTYIMTNFVYVLSNASLTIEAGTVIKGRDGSYTVQDGIPGGFGCLVINRGAKLFAEGTACNPIIFTAEQDDVNDPFDMPVSGPGSRGLWGGIVINGRAPINASIRLNLTPIQDVYEGLPDAFAPAAYGGEPLFRFGGDDPDDNSGILRYVSIRHGGKQIEANREINGLSLGGVGRGTTIEFVECYLIADDGFEFFGGTVNTKYLVSAFNDDDSFDTDQGYSGKNQFWFTIQAPDARDEGGEFNGIPNELDARGSFPFESTFQVYNWTAIGAGTGTNTGNEALVIRQRSRPEIHNSVFVEFDGRKLVLGTNAIPAMTNNLFWRCTQGNGALGSIPSASLDLNPEANPLLRGIDRGQNSRLDPRPLPNSPVFTAYSTPPNDGFYTPVNYKGAFDACDNWMRGWTALDQNLILGTLFNQPSNIVYVGGFITNHVTWYATNIYVMTNFVYVLSNASLTIEAGTVIKGRDGSYTVQDGIPGGFGCLVINRGAKLFAEGTACNPIIFTAEQDDVNDPFDMPVSGPGSRGLWGGIVINGRAPINASIRLNLTPIQDVYEGLPDAFAPAAYGGEPLFRFGGDDPDDNSGILRYVSIRHGGKQIEANREINGLSLGGVGRGTTIEFVECYLIADDGFEFFGGTVNTKYLVSAFNDDDSFDTDQGYSGKNQFWFTIQAPDARDEGGEFNGIPNELDARGSFPFESTFQVYNWTAIGAGTGTNTGNEALVIRQRSRPEIHNSVFVEFDGRKLVLGTNAIPAMTNNLFWRCTQGNGALGSIPSASLDLNPEANPLLRSISRVNDARLLPVPEGPHSPVYAAFSTPPHDGFYVPAPYKGAFHTNNWMLRWTALDNNGFLSWQMPPPALVQVVTCPQPLLTITRSGSNVVVSWNSTSGCTYQVQSKSPITGTWSPLGTPVVGDGTVKSVVIPATDTEQYFRLMIQ
jgi:hypothetical protein